MCSKVNNSAGPTKKSTRILPGNMLQSNAATCIKHCRILDHDKKTFVDPD